MAEVMLSRDDHYYLDDEHGTTRVEVPDDQVARWRQVMNDFDVVQIEMAAAYDAGVARDAEQERIRRAQAEVAAAEARLELAMWEVEHRPDDPASWPFIGDAEVAVPRRIGDQGDQILDGAIGDRPCVGPQRPDEKAARAERMRLHGAWPGIRFDLKPYVCVEGHWHIGRSS